MKTDKKMTGRIERTLKVARNVGRNFREHGFKHGVKYSAHKVLERREERRLGITTSGYLWLSDLGIRTRAYHDYVAIDYRSLWRTMRSLEIAEDRDVFLDVGSGMGRAVIVAATFPFRKSIGVEISPDLCDIAQQNVHRAQKHLRCRNVEIVNANILEYAFPDEVTVVFLFNPFGPEILAATLEKLQQSLARSARPLTLIYRPPGGTEQNPLDDYPELLRGQEVLSYTGRPLYVYRWDEPELLAAKG